MNAVSIRHGGRERRHQGQARGGVAQAAGVALVRAPFAFASLPDRPEFFLPAHKGGGPRSPSSGPHRVRPRAARAFPERRTPTQCGELMRQIPAEKAPSLAHCFAPHAERTRAGGDVSAYFAAKPLIFL